MTYKYILRSEDDLTNRYPHWLISAWLSYGDNLMNQVNWFIKHGARFNEPITSYTIFRELNLMSRKKAGSNGSFQSGNQRFNRSEVQRGDIKWYNRRLDNDDLVALEQSEFTLQELLLDLVDLAVGGVGISIRHTDSGKSVSVSLIYTDTANGGNVYGLSSFGSNLRDALLVTVYKYRVYLEEDFSNLPHLCTHNQQERRFG